MYNYPYGDNQQINLNWIISEIIALHQRLDPDYTAPTFTQIYPFSETQQLNLDWILTELKALKELAPTPAPTDAIDEVGQALIAGAYDSDTQYQKNDYIVQDGKVYRANAATTGTFDPTKWREVMLGDDLAIITRWADATNTYLNNLAASNVSNDSIVAGDTVKDALATLNGAINAISPTSYGAVYDGTTDCTAAIQAAINNANGKTVKFAGNGTAIISSTIVIKEDTHIELDKGFTLKMKNASNCPMFKNAPSDLNYNDSGAGQNIQNNISIVGGILDFNGNNQTWQNTNFRLNVGIILCDVNNLLIKDVQLIDPITFGIFLNGISNFTIENIFCNYSNQNLNMDGVHLGGKCEYGTIDNIYGTSNDDFIALNSGDVIDRNVLLRVGATHDIVVKNIKCYNGYRAVRLLAGNVNSGELYNISIENIEGTFRYGAVLFSTYSTSTRAYYRNISVKNVICDCSTNCDLITFQGNYTQSSTLEAEAITIENVMYRQKTSKLVNVIKITPQSTVYNLILNDVIVTTDNIDISAKYLICGSGTISSLIISNVDLKKPTSYDGMQSVETTVVKNHVEVNNFVQNGETVGYLPGEHIPIDGQWLVMSNGSGSEFGLLVQSKKYLPNKTMTTANIPSWVRGNGQHVAGSNFTFKEIQRVNDYLLNIAFSTSANVPAMTACVGLFNVGSYATF